MTPQEKNVFGKLFTKTELGTHKVDLALFDDIKKAVLTAKDLKEKIESNFTLANGGLRAVADFEKFYGSAVSKANELGVDIPKEIVGLTDLVKSYQTFFTKIKSI
jgi:hypothetical protein